MDQETPHSAERQGGGALSVQDWSARRAGVLLALITLLAAVLRVAEIDASLWADELWTRFCAVHGLRWSMHRWGVSLNPGYMYMPVLCAQYLGFSEGVLRLPSLIAGVLAVPALYALVRDIHSRRAGLVAAWMLSINAFHVGFSMEARMYAPVMLGAILTVWLLYRALAQPEAFRWGLFVLAAFWAAPLHLLVLPFLGVIVFTACCHRVFSGAHASWRARLKSAVAPALCGLIGISGTLALMAYVGATPLAFLKGYEDTAADMTLAAPGTYYRLTPLRYAGFLVEYLAVKPIPVQAALWLCMAVGFVCLWRRARPLAWLLGAALILLPLPMMAVRTTHFWVARHLCFLLPLMLVLGALGVICAADGLGAALRRLFGRLGRLLSFEGQEWDPLLRRAMLGVFLAVFTLPATAALRREFDARPVEDAKGFAKYLSTSLDPTDMLCFSDMTSRFWTEMVLDYSAGLERPAIRATRESVLGQPSREEFEHFLIDNPFTTLCFVQYGGPFRLHTDLLTSLGALRREFRRADVWRLGAPTVNLVPNGGAEPEPGIEGLRHLVVQGEAAYEGKRCFRLTGDAMKGVALEFDLGRFTYRLRNSSFEAAPEKGPIGWTQVGGAVEVVEGVKPETHAAALLPAETDVLLEQPITLGLAPGRTVSVAADGRADVRDLLFLELCYDLPGEQQSVRVAHPGTGIWSKLQLEAPVPANAYPDSFRVRVRRAGGVSGAAAVDHAEVAVPAEVGALDPTLTYTLSLMVRFENLIPSDVRRTDLAAATLSFAWFDTERGAAGSLRLDRWAGSSDWRHLVFQLRPGANIPRAMSHAKVHLRFPAGAIPDAVIYVDNVQLEPGTAPTPFVNGRRLPHDEALAGLRTATAQQ